MKYVYPTCANTFRQWLMSNVIYNNIYINLGSPKPFDVSLRDGLQALTKKEQTDWSTETKVKLYKEIIDKHHVHDIEIGSLVSNKIFPVFNDTLSLYNILHLSNLNIYGNNYILIPNKHNL